MAISFNDWISLRSARRHPAVAALAPKWQTARGRLTADSVEKRAGELGLPPGTGADAWTEYCNDVHGAGPAGDIPSPPDAGN